MLIDKIKEATSDVLCKYAYRGVKEHIKGAKTLEFLEKIKESEGLGEIRWFCKEEFTTLNRIDQFDELESDLDNAFKDKERLLKKDIH